MLILSQIIFKSWFKSLVSAVVVLFLLITTADLINGFLQGKDGARVLLEYALKMPDLMGKMFPICCLVASLFSLNNLKSHSELIAILASGYSYQRVYSLIGGCALLMVFVQFINLGYLEPYANKVKRQEITKSRDSEGRYLTRSSIEGGKFWYKTSNYFASFTFFDRKSLSLNDFEIYYFTPDSLGSKIIQSKMATYQPHEKKWLLIDAKETSSLHQLTFPLQRELGELSLSLQEVPEDFGEFEADLTTLSFVGLYRFVNRLSKTDLNISEYEIILWNKVFLSITCFVFALIPVSTIFNPNRRSSSFGKNVAFTLLTTVVFWVLYTSCVALGNSGTLSPIVATGIIPMILLGYVVWTFNKNRKLSF
ncbi:MAG TPA: LptF/LptG family permease [Bacteriovoracaceae bacterium]|nr:LptF/LptG family permease [Bacteriovoracaceae bacterium]